MLEDFENKRVQQVSQRRAIADYGMGAFFSLLGLLFLLHRIIGFDFGRRSPAMDLVFGTMCVLYGGWRIYRGYKKNYFK